MKNFFVIILTSFILISCGSTQRDLFSENNKFQNKNIESPFYGNPSSKVQLMIFSDFQCPACIRFENAVGEKLQKEYIDSGKIGLTYKNFPLNIHPNAPEDALAGLCAHEQGKYIEFAKKMFALEEKKAGLEVTNSERVGLAKEIGLDINKFTGCENGGFYVDKIKSDMAEGEKMGLEGTPSVYINGTSVDMTKFDDIFTIIDKLLNKNEY